MTRIAADGGDDTNSAAKIDRDSLQSDRPALRCAAVNERILPLLFSASLACAALATACAAASSTSGFDDVSDGGAAADAQSGPLGSSEGGSGTGFGEGGGGGGNPGNQPAVVYGHSDNTLYKLDPDTKAVSVLGTFQGCTKVTDVALDANSNMYVTTQTGLYSVDIASVKCTLIAMGTYPNSLSFVPAGTLDPNVEALVGYVDDEYVRIDLTSGKMTNIGKLNGGSGVVSSGDIVSVKGGSTYLTVKGGSSCTKNDCLLEVDPTTGAMTHNWGSVGHQSVFGLAFWAGAVYGFDNAGDLFEVDFSGTKAQTTAIPIPSAPSGLQFWGAGSTTSAPVGPK
jgi:hypothetical protein